MHNAVKDSDTLLRDAKIQKGIAAANQASLRAQLTVAKASAAAIKAELASLKQQQFSKKKKVAELEEEELAASAAQTKQALEQAKSKTEVELEDIAIERKEAERRRAEDLTRVSHLKQQLEGSVQAMDETTASVAAAAANLKGAAAKAHDNEVALADDTIAQATSDQQKGTVAEVEITEHNSVLEFMKQNLDDLHQTRVGLSKSGIDQAALQHAVAKIELERATEFAQNAALSNNTKMVQAAEVVVAQATLTMQAVDKKSANAAQAYAKAASVTTAAEGFLHSARSRYSALKKEAESAETGATEAQRKLELAMKQHSKMMAKFAKTQGEEENKLEAAQADAQAKISAAEEKLAKASETAQEASAETDKLKHNIAMAHEQAASQMTPEIAATEGVIAKAEQQQHNLASALAAAQVKVEELHEEMAHNASKVEDETAQANQLRGKVAEIQAGLAVQSAPTHELQNTLKELKTLRLEAQAAKSSLQEATTKVNKGTASIKLKQGQLATAREEERFTLETSIRLETALLASAKHTATRATKTYSSAMVRMAGLKDKLSHGILHKAELQRENTRQELAWANEKLATAEAQVLETQTEVNKAQTIEAMTNASVARLKSKVGGKESLITSKKAEVEAALKDSVAHDKLLEEAQQRAIQGDLQVHKDKVLQEQEAAKVYTPYIS